MGWDTFWVTFYKLIWSPCSQQTKKKNLGKLPNLGQQGGE
jgi:hypothetical protein